MKTKLIVEIEHRDHVHLPSLRDDLDGFLRPYREAFPHEKVTVTLAEPLQVRDTMPADGGWIEWKGGECPVELLDSDVTVRFRDGEVYERRRAAREWIWRHSGESDDIVSYRVLP